MLVANIVSSKIISHFRVGERVMINANNAPSYSAKLKQNPILTTSN